MKTYMLTVIICVLIFIQINHEFLLLGVTQHIESHFCFCYYPFGKISQPQTLFQIEGGGGLANESTFNALYVSSFIYFLFFTHKLND